MFALNFVSLLQINFVTVKNINIAKGIAKKDK